jgi:hypothetical protein
MLETVDGRVRFEETVREHYTHFLDLRLAREDSRAQDLLRPVSDLDGFAAELAAERGESSFTDLLVTRLDR